jgi:hypothetical protein
MTHPTGTSPASPAARACASAMSMNDTVIPDHRRSARLVPGLMPLYTSTEGATPSTGPRDENELA